MFQSQYNRPWCLHRERWSGLTMGASTPLCLNWWGAFSVDRTDHHRFVLTGQRIFYWAPKNLLKWHDHRLWDLPVMAVGWVRLALEVPHCYQQQLRRSSWAQSLLLIYHLSQICACFGYRCISWPQIKACESVTYSWSDSKVMLSSKLLLGGKICKM